MAFQPATGDLADAIQARFMGGTSGSPTGGPYAVGDYKVDPVNKEIWVCTVAGSPGTWVALGGGATGFNILDYGADPTGVADSTAAIQAAWNEAAGVVGNGGIAFHPPGIFKCLGQLIVPAGKSITIMGAGKLASIVYYAGAALQPFVVFPGQNHGSQTVDITITGGVNASPAVQILASGGSGTNGYNSLITMRNSWIGYYYPPGGSAPASFLAYGGVQAQCDVFRMIDCDVWGRDYGLRLQQGTTDVYLSESYFATLPQASEPDQIGLWCDDAGTLDFVGTLNAVNCGVAGAGAATTAARVRSAANLINCYCESSNLPLDAVTCALHLDGGNWAADSTAKYIFSANGSSGYLAPASISLAGITALTNIVYATGSSFSRAWTVRLPNKAAIVGTFPAAPFAIDQPASVNCPGYNPIGAVTITPAAHAWQNTTGSTVEVYVNVAGTYTGTTTLTPQGDAAVTLPNAVVGIKYTLKQWDVLTWGVGGTVTNDPQFLGIGD